MPQRNGLPKIPREILDEAIANGWSVARAKGDHLRWTNPRATRVVFSAGTPSDRRTWFNHLASLRRALRGSAP